MKELTQEKKKSLYKYLFHYNDFTDEWSCFNREDYVCYFNGTKPAYNIGRGKTIEEAIENKKDG